MMYSLLAASLLALSSVGGSLLADRKNAINVGDLPSFPTSVSFGYPSDDLDNNSAFDPAWSGVIDKEHVCSFDLGYFYVPLKASASLIDGYWSLESITFGRVSFFYYEYRNFVDFSCVAPIFGMYSPASEVYYLYQKVLDLSGVLDYSDKMQAAVTEYELDGDYAVIYSNYMTTTTSGPYSFWFDGEEYLGLVEGYYFRLFMNAYNLPYGAGYYVGEQRGYDKGYAEGYQVGRADGYSEASEDGAVITNLFGAVVSVPIDVLNGLAPFAIWNVPVIGIIMTFLFAALIFFMLRKLF